MRTLTLYMAALVSVLGIASASQSAVIIDFEVGGQNPANALVSSSITVDIYLTATGATSITGYQFAIIYSNVSGGNTLVNAPVFASSGAWITGGLGLAFPVNGPGEYLTAISASTITPLAEITAAAGKISLGSIKFHVDAVSLPGFEVTGCFNCGAFGPTGDGMFINAGSAATTFNGLNLVPEPTTASLLGLGLLGLTVAGRRRN